MLALGATVAGGQALTARPVARLGQGGRVVVMTRPLAARVQQRDRCAELVHSERRYYSSDGFASGSSRGDAFGDGPPSFRGPSGSRGGAEGGAPSFRMGAAPGISRNS